MRPPRLLALLASLGLALALALASSPAFAAPAPAPALSAALAPAASDEEEVALDSPRASVERFRRACEAGRYAEAAIYLDVPRAEAARAPELARMLNAVLSRRLWIEPDQLSPRSSGRRDDGLPTSTDEIGRIKANGHMEPVRLVRREARNADEEPRWIFAQSTVARVDIWYSGLEDRWLRQRLPDVLLREGPRALMLWQWLALPLLMLAAHTVGRPIAWILGRILRRIVRRTRTPLDDALAVQLAPPLRLACALPFLLLGTRYLGLYPPAQAFLDHVLKALALLTLFWGLFRVVGNFGENLIDTRWGKEHPGWRSVSAFSTRAGRLVVVSIGVVSIVSELGYPVGSLIAGFGIGGIAIALAAQKTVENLFGSVSILVDQPFRVGDTIRVDGVEGVVENIGLRSTRIRTPERSLVVVPNGKLADMRTESMSARDCVRFSCKLRLPTRATTAQITAVIQKVTSALEAHPKLRREEVLVRLTALGDSFEVDASAPVETTQAREFADTRQELLLSCVDALRAAGVDPAAPGSPDPPTKAAP